MKKKGIIIIPVLIVLCLMYPIGRLFIADTPAQAETGKISPKIKLYAFFSGGYSRLYDKLIEKGMDGKDALNYISKGLGNTLYEEADAKKIPPVPPVAEFTGNYDNPFIYHDGVKGLMPDIDKYYKDFVTALDKKTKAEIRFTERSPDITLEQIKQLTSLRGQFHTSYSSSSAGRKHNIKLAAGFLNGCIIEPFESMSFNETVGPRSPARGFQMAGIISGGEMVSGYGGGVCQVSSTVYNACLMAGLEIVNARRHSRIIPYLPASRDAMVTSSSDLIVNNPTANRVYIVTKATGYELFVAVYGEKSEYEYIIENKIIKTIPPPAPVIKVVGNNVSESVKNALLSNNPERMRNIAYFERITKKPGAGVVSEAYLKLYKDGILTETKLISRDTYPARRGEIVRIVR